MTIMLELGVRIDRPLTRGAAHSVANLIFRSTGLWPGVDARDLALGLRLRVCPRSAGPTEVVDGRVLYYDWSLYPSERNHEISRAIAVHFLRFTDQATTANVNELTMALTRRASGTFSVVA